MDICLRCQKQGQTCGPKQLPTEDVYLRENDARERENRQAADDFIQLRLANGQDWNSILALLDPNGSIAPFPANPPQNNQILTPYPQLNTSLPQSAKEITMQNTFQQVLPDPAVSNVAAMTWDSTPVSTNNSNPGYLTQTGGQMHQLLPSDSFPPTGVFNPVGVYTTNSDQTSVDSLTDYGGQAGFVDSNQPGTSSNVGVHTFNTGWSPTITNQPSFANGVATNATSPQGYPYPYSQFSASFSSNENQY